MLRISRLVVGIVAAVALAFAQTQIATVTSDGGFQLRGASVTPGQGVANWPVMAGDTIQAGQTPVTIVFTDGSVIMLAPGSSAKIDMSGKQPEFQLVSGDAHYSLKTLDSVKMVFGNKTIVAKDLSGELGAQKLAQGWWSAGHTTAVVVAAGGTTVLGIAATTAKPPKPSCGPASNYNCK